MPVLSPAVKQNSLLIQKKIPKKYYGISMLFYMYHDILEKLSWKEWFSVP